MDSDRFLTNLARQAEENPVLALGVAAGLLTSLSKLVNSVAWKQEVRRRNLKDLRKNCGCLNENSWGTRLRQVGRLPNRSSRRTNTP